MDRASPSEPDPDCSKRLLERLATQVVNDDSLNVQLVAVTAEKIVRADFEDVHVGRCRDRTEPHPFWIDDIPYTVGLPRKPETFRPDVVEPIDDE